MGDLQEDRLFKRLKAGTATASDQNEATKWIEWMDQFVPEQAEADRRDGYAIIPYEKARR